MPLLYGACTLYIHVCLLFNYRLLDILEVIAPYKHFHKLRQFCHMKLPPGFPVKLGQPVLNLCYSVHCTCTLTHVHVHCNKPQLFYIVYSEYIRVRVHVCQAGGVPDKLHTCMCVFKANKLKTAIQGSLVCLAPVIHVHVL